LPHLFLQLGGQQLQPGVNDRDERRQELIERLKQSGDRSRSVRIVCVHGHGLW
jgi:hypothetical protein